MPNLESGVFEIWYLRNKRWTFFTATEGATVLDIIRVQSIVRQLRRLGWPTDVRFVE